MTEPRDLARAWRAVLGHLQLELPRPAFITFLDGTSPIRLDGATLLVEASRLNVEEVNGRLRTVVERAAHDVFGEEIRVLFVPRGSASNASCAGDSPSASNTPGGAGALLGNINRRYTFDRYLPASGNQFAHRCCLDLLTPDAVVPSPVVLFGRPGMGKTHLLHALASRASAAGWSVAYLSAEDFTSAFTRAVFKRTVEDFHDKVRTAQLLLLDDLQDLAGRTKTQQELVQTMETVANSGGSVVVASEQHPHELDLIERLASRLEGGLSIRILPFVGDERRRYVETLARESVVSLPGWAIDRIVGVEFPSVRVLHGATQSAIFLARQGLLDMAQLDAHLVRAAVAEVTSGELADRDLLEAVALQFQLCFEDLTGPSRKGAAPTARAVAAALLQERGNSLSQIGSALGRHRSTINELAVRGRALLESDPALRSRLAG